MITWGLVGNSHDASLAVFDKQELLWASLAKEFSKVPNDPHLNEDLRKTALGVAGWPDQVVWYERPRLKTCRQFLAGQGWLWQENDIKKYLATWGIRGTPIKYTQHHTSHAAYAYYTQPYDECAVICLDSIGEFETLTIWDCTKGKMSKIHSQGYPHSLGLFYSAMTQRLGLVPQRDEYLVAQWAVKGDPKRLSAALRNEIIDVDHKHANPQYIKMRTNLHRGCRSWRPDLVTQQDMYDLAAATQAVFEYCVNVLSIWTKWKTGKSNLALAGGGALNRQAVDGIRHMWDTVWVPPNPGDPGSCVGAVLAQTKTRINNVDKKWYKSV
jgi:carbamoyltransferase